MMNSVLVVTNFNAGRKQAVKFKKKVLDFIIKRTKDFKFVDIDELKTLDVTPFDTIFAMGGDGTVNKVLPYLAGTDKTLGIIPCGTANLLAAKLGFLGNLNKTLKTIEKNNIKEIDVLDINNQFCALRCGIGYDADIICKTPQSLKNKFGYFAYFVAGILFALRLKMRRYNFIIDGKNCETDASCIIIANAANMYRNFFATGSNCMLDDGLMEIFVLKTQNPILFFFEFLKIFFNIHKDSKIASYIKAKEIKTKENWLNCHIDGEKRILKDDISIKIQEKFIKVFCK